jgi:hypothetical protein
MIRLQAKLQQLLVDYQNAVLSAQLKSSSLRFISASLVCLQAGFPTLYPCHDDTMNSGRFGSLLARATRTIRHQLTDKLEKRQFAARPL